MPTVISYYCSMRIIKPAFNSHRMHSQRAGVYDSGSSSGSGSGSGSGSREQTAVGGCGLRGTE